MIVCFVVGGPLPSWAPEGFFDVFNTVAVGEGEETLLELADSMAHGQPLCRVKGLVYRNRDHILNTGERGFIKNLDSLAFPTRELFDNEAYKKYYQERFGYSISSMITSRGCPFSCDFCSRPIFGADMRMRSVDNIVDEVEEIAAFGYDRVWFVDDCFTLNRNHLLDVCSEIVKRGVDIGWECLSRVDTMDAEVAEGMKRADCIGVFFGIESGNDSVLNIMKKRITTAQSQHAVIEAKAAGLKVGAFFIVGYPGESDKTVWIPCVLLQVCRLTTYPSRFLTRFLEPPLYERVKDKGVAIEDWEEPKNYRLIRHKLLYTSGFSEGKLKFAIGKAQAQFYGRKHFGETGYNILCKPFESVTDVLFKLMP